MKRHAIFVDAGYVFAQGSFSLLGSKIPRTQLKLDASEVVEQLISLALSQSLGVPLLRLYWYDGARHGPTVDHLAIARMDNVKLRLGSINSAGEQKEVDSLLVTDLIDLARNQSICDASIVTADIDMRIAVQVAQTFGVRVHLVGIEPSRVSQSPLLRQEADTVHEIPRAHVAKFLAALPAPESKASSGITPTSHEPRGKEGAKGIEQKTLGQIIDEGIQKTLAAGGSDLSNLKAALTSSSGIPVEYDRRLLGTCRTLLGRDLTGDERREMRSLFRHQVLALGKAEKS